MAVIDSQSTTSSTSLWDNTSSWGKVAAGAQALSGAIQAYQAYSAGRQQAKSLKNNAKQLYENSKAYEKEGDSLLQAARFYRQGAELSKEGGKRNMRNLRYQGAEIDEQEQIMLSDSLRAARQRYGEGRAAFAANGILLEGREGSVTQMWEEDEAKNAAKEQLIIMNDAESQIHGYMVAAQEALIQGYQEAIQGYSQASSAAAQASSAYANSNSAWLQAKAAEKAAKKAKRSGLIKSIGTIATTVGAVAATVATGGAAGVAIAAAGAAATNAAAGGQ